MAHSHRRPLPFSLPLLSLALLALLSSLPILPSAAQPYNKWMSGFTASYYNLQNRPPFACGYGAGTVQGNTASVSAALFGNGTACGQCLALRCVGHPACKTAVVTTPVTVTNLCPANAPGGYCSGRKLSVTLPTPVWNLMSKDAKIGVVPVQVSRVQCKRVGGVAFNVSGSQYYVAVMPLNINGPGDLRRVDISISRGPWLPMRHSYGGVWDFPGQQVTGVALSFRLWPRMGGLPLEAWNAVPPAWIPNTIYKTKVNFPW